MISQAVISSSKFFDLNQIQGSSGHARLFPADAPAPTAIGVTIDKGEFEMNITEKLFLASVLALSTAAPVQMILNKRRAEALKTCTHNKAFDSDSYVACMARLGEAP
jgi:hypothetical protein